MAIEQARKNLWRLSTLNFRAWYSRSAGVSDRISSEIQVLKYVSEPRQAYFGPETALVRTPVLTRADLLVPIQDPAIIEEYDAGFLVPPEARAEMDEYGNIVIIF